MYSIIKMVILFSDFPSTTNYGLIGSVSFPSSLEEFLPKKVYVRRTLPDDDFFIQGLTHAAQR